MCVLRDSNQHVTTEYKFGFEEMAEERDEKGDELATRTSLKRLLVSRPLVRT